MARPVETAAFLLGDRHLPPNSIVRAANAYREQGVDMIGYAHQLGNFVPDQLWKPEHTPVAERLPDPDSINDAFMSAAYTVGAMGPLPITINTDSIRMGPAHLIQSMMTLSHMTQGNAIFNIGGGEIKQLNPYGWKRSDGLKRFEDLMNLFTMFWETDGPITYEGKLWNFNHAFLGGAKPHRPRIHAMGGGPRLMDLATSHCDGFTSAVPCVWPTAEHAAVAIAGLRQDLVRKNRDPDDFGISIQAVTLIHEDEDVLSRAMENPILRWIAAMWGRIQPTATWEESGLVSPTPPDWSYHLHFRPHDTDDAWLDDVLGKTTPEHVRNGFICGSPHQVAETLAQYADAGATIISALDFLPLVLDPSDRGTLGRISECLRRVKALTATPADKVND